MSSYDNWINNSNNILRSNDPDKYQLLLDEANSFFEKIHVQFSRIIKKKDAFILVGSVHEHGSLNLKIFPNNSNNIEILIIETSSPKITGKIILNTIIEFGYVINSHSICLEDMSSVNSRGCSNDNINLALFKIIKDGKSWYESPPYNFQSYKISKQEKHDFYQHNEHIRNTLFIDYFLKDICDEFKDAFPDIDIDSQKVKEVFAQILLKKSVFNKAQCDVTKKMSRFLQNKHTGVKYSNELILYLNNTNEITTIIKPIITKIINPIKSRGKQKNKKTKKQKTKKQKNKKTKKQKNKNKTI